ncbi:MAG: hypothetical protein M1827_001613 [Pycnora praestabilis]|nr:MAG: hypothetical protein M1827_001613 [Pycnora praestabilis]
MPSNTTQPSSSFPQNYANSESLLPDPSQSANDTLNLNQYILTDSPNPRLESILPTPVAPSHQPNAVSAAPMNPFGEFSLPFQTSPRDIASFDHSIDGHMPSPKQRTGSVSNPRRASLSEFAGRGDSMPAVRGHRTSISSAGAFGHHNRHGSLGESDVTSPGSFRGPNGQDSIDGYEGRDSLRHFSSGSAGIEGGDHGDSRVKEEKDHVPPWSDLKTKAGKERKRLPLACIACRRKKIRCSGEKPACKHCLRSRIPCVYKVTTRKAAPRTDYMAMLDKRLKRMEERVIKIIPKNEVADIMAAGRAIVKPVPASAPSKGNNGKKRPAEEAFGAELNEWANSKPATNIDGASKSWARQQRTDDTEEKKLLAEGVESLPPQEIQEHLAEVFFESLYGQTYHLLHKPSFMRKLRAGSVPPVLILAVCAISARFSTHPQLNQEPAFLRGETWGKAAREIALKKYDEPNITILTVYLILGLHEFGTCQGGRSWMLGGMAIRMAYALQLHRDLDHDPLGRKNGSKAELSFTDREIRRRVMWACFLMDRFNSSGTERPTFINEQYIKVQLPIKEKYFQMEIPGPTESLEGDVPNPISPDAGQAYNPQHNMGVAAYNIRVIALWGRVIKYLNLGGKDRDPHPLWSSQSQFAELKSQIENFKANLPESLHYNEGNLHTYSTDKLANQFLFLHIAYHQVVLFMNRFAIPSAPGGRPSDQMPREFFKDAGHAAIEAANNISTLIADSADHGVVAPFVGYCAFLSSTVHIFVIFSKNTNLEATSKKNLAYNVDYLRKMKKYWGMFHFMAESLKDIYRQHADVALKGPKTGGQRQNPPSIFQYGDWFDRYPRGVSRTDFEDPACEIKRESSSDGVLSSKSDLQSVEDFFAGLSPPSKVEHQRKAARKHHNRTAPVPSIPNQSSTQAALLPPTNAGHQTQPLLASQMNLTMPDHAMNRGFHQHIDASHPSAGGTDMFQQPPPQSFPPDYQADLSFLQPNQGMLQQLDRQLVYGAYAGMDSTTMSQGMGNPNFWDNMDISGMGPGFMNEPSSAWFMPFNMDPPEIGDDGSMFGNAVHNYQIHEPEPQ